MKKLLVIVVLVFLFSNIGFSDHGESFNKDNNIGIFGIILGDHIDNYEHEKCVESYRAYRCYLKAKIQNKNFKKHQVTIYPLSGEIFEIISRSNNFSSNKECKDNVKTIPKLVAEKKESQGMKIIKFKGKIGYYIDKNNFVIDLAGPGRHLQILAGGCTSTNNDLALRLFGYSKNKMDKEVDEIKKNNIDTKGF